MKVIKRKCHGRFHVLLSVHVPPRHSPSLEAWPLSKALSGDTEVTGQSGLYGVLSAVDGLGFILSELT